jgi:hypothetical protein
MRKAMRTSNSAMVERRSQNYKYVTVTTRLPPFAVDAMAAPDDLR